jgi:2,4-dienoyl-CoA reductase-like NADH-dependent reductase (Old Yellow Enzyme family)
VHRVGGKIFPQLWHMGVLRNAKISRYPDYPNARPSGTIGTVGKHSIQPELLKELMVPGESLTEREVEDIVAAFAFAARSAKGVGFDGIALHGGHGYLIDNFLWRETNKRSDRYGGDHVGRTRFAVEIIRAVRREVGAYMPIMFRFSQHKQQDYHNNLVLNPKELEEILVPLADAGVDIFDASQRRVERATFEGSDLNLAGWAKKLTGKPSMTIGGIGLHFDAPEHASNRTTIAAASAHNNLPEVMRRFRRGDFDLVGSGRSLLSDPGWARRIRNGETIMAFDRSCESRLT